MKTAWQKTAAFAALIIAIGLVVYWRALGGEFVYDDLSLVLANPRVQGDVPLVEGVMGSFWGFDGAGAEGRVGYWRPLSFLVLRLGAWLGGGAATFHWISLGLHVGAALVAWRLGVRLLRSETGGMIAGILFLVHPVQVESVAWISAVSDPLQGLFGLGALLTVLRWRDAGSRGLPIGAALCVAFALGAKEQGLTLMPLIALLVWLVPARSESPGSRSSKESAPSTVLDSPWSQRLRLWLPLAVVCLGYYALRISVFGDALAGFDRANADLGLDFARGSSFRFELFGGFLTLLALPIDLNTFRPFEPLFDATSASFIRAVFAVPIWILLFSLALRARARAPIALLLFIPIALSPILINANAAGEFPLSERYLYMPAFAFAALVAWASERLNFRRSALPRLALAILFTIQTTARIHVWQNETTLFETAVLQNSNSPFAHWSLGRVLLTKASESPNQELLAQASTQFELSLMAGTKDGLPDPAVWISSADRLQAQLGLGFCALQLSAFPPHDLTRAKTSFMAAASEAPTSARAWLGLGMVESEIGKTQLETGNRQTAQATLRGALERFARALKLEPDLDGIWSARARTLAALGDWPLAIQAFEMALASAPANTEIELALVRCMIEAERFDEAGTRLQGLRRSAPDSPEVRLVAALLANQIGDIPAALSHLNALLDLEPNHGEALLTRGKILIAAGDLEAALANLQRAAEAMPGSFDAHYNVAGLLLRTNPAAAQGPLVAAYRLCPPNQLRELLRQQLLPLTALNFDLAMALARADEKRGAPGAALDFVNQALASKPGAVNATELRAHLLRARR